MEPHRMENAKYLDLIAKYLSGNLADRERETLFAWVEKDTRNRAFFEEMIDLWSVSTAYEDEPFEADTEQAWSALDARLNARLDGQSGAGAVPAPEPDNGQARVVAMPTSKKSPRSSRRMAWLPYAAAILLLITAGLLWQADPLNWWTDQYATARGETATYTLPDGSEVTLNGATQLSFRSWFGTRRVRLAGEAFFDVRRDEQQPFEILSGAARTVVLGTAFNVRAYPEEDRIEITVERGTVRVEERQAPRRERAERAVLLEAGTSAVFEESTQELRRTETAISNATAWKTGVLSFDNLPLAEVVPVLERVYGVTIRVENAAILDCPFTMTIIDKPAASVLGQIDLIFDEIEFRQNPDGSFTLSGQGCSQ